MAYTGRMAQLPQGSGFPGVQPCAIGEGRPRNIKWIRCRSAAFRGNSFWMQTLALDPRSLSVLICVTGTVSTLLLHLHVKVVPVKGKRVAESQEAGTEAQPGEGSQVLPEPR